jgi:hypothetical protein
VTDLERFAHSCRAGGLILDANVLTLLVVGRVNRGRIATFKRTRRYDSDAFDLLGRVIAPASKLYTIAHVLAEVSNLTDMTAPLVCGKLGMSPERAIGRKVRSARTAVENRRMIAAWGA